MYMNHHFKPLCSRNMYITVARNDRYVQNEEEVGPILQNNDYICMI